MENAVLNAGEGRTVWVVGDRYTIKASGDDTGGAFALIEALVPPGSGPPAHVHGREDEAFYILEGSLRFHRDGHAFDAPTGTWVTLAKGSVHRFENLGPTPARMLLLVIPAGLDRFFLEIGRAPRPGEVTPPIPTPDDFARLLAAAPGYGLEIRPHA